MEERIKNYEGQIANLKRWRNWLYVVILLYTIAIAYFSIDAIVRNKKASDAEILYAAGQVEYMGLEHSWILRHNEDDYLDLDLYLDWARKDPEVMRQVEKNREKR